MQKIQVNIRKQGTTGLWVPFHKWTHFEKHFLVCQWILNHIKRFHYKFTDNWSSLTTVRRQFLPASSRLQRSNTAYPRRSGLSTWPIRWVWLAVFVDQTWTSARADLRALPACSYLTHLIVPIEAGKSNLQAQYPARNQTKILLLSWKEHYLFPCLNCYAFPFLMKFYATSFDRNRTRKYMYINSKSKLWSHF